MDVVSVGLQVRDDGTVQVKAFGDASEKTAKRIADLEAQLNKMAGTQNRATAIGEGHRLATGKVSRALEGLIVSATGANAHMGALSVAMSDMALGGVVVTGVLAGVAAISYVYEKLTKDARDAKKEQEDLIATFLKAQKLKSQGGVEGATVAAFDEQVRAAQARVDEIERVNAMVNAPHQLSGGFLGGVQSSVAADSAALKAALGDLRAAVAERDAILQKSAQDADNTYAQNLASLIGFNAKDKQLREQGIAIMEAWKKTYDLLPKTDIAGRAQLAGNITALHDALFPKGDAEKAAREAKEYADAVERVKKANDDMALAHAKGVVSITTERDQADKLLTAAKTGTVAWQDQADEIEAINKLMSAGIFFIDAEYESLKKSLIVTAQERREVERINQARTDAAEKAKEVAKKQAEEEARITENLIRGLQDSWSQFFENIFTKGISSFKDFISSIKDLFLKMVAELLAANLMKRLSAGLAAVFGNMGASSGSTSTLSLSAQRWARVGGAAVGGAIAGYGLGQAAGNAGGGAAAGALGGAATGFAIAGPTGALIGGLTGLVGGLLGGAQAAREAAEAFRQMKKDYELAVAEFKHDDLATALSQNAAAAEQLRQQAEKLYGPMEKLAKLFGISSSQYTSQVDQINAQEKRNAEQLQKKADEDARYAQEDLEVRNLRATGRGDEADRIAFKEQQDREMQAAVDKADADGTRTVAEQLYLNTLATTQNNELIAFLNGTLQDATRNSPTGFFANQYYQPFVTPVGAAPADPFNTGLPPLNAPNEPSEPAGTGAASGSGLTPPGGSRNAPNNTGTSHGAPAGAVSLNFASGSIQINGDRSGDEMLNDFLDAVDSAAAGSGGAGSSRAAALELLKRRAVR